MIQFPFDERKAAQAGAYLAWRHGGACDYRRLVKLLYLADRRAFLEDGLPITGDELWSMKQGPVLSKVMDSINRRNGFGYVWCLFLKEKAPNYQIALVSESFATDELSDYELGILEAVDLEFGSMADSALLDYFHKLPEHTVTTTRHPIFFEKLLAVEGPFTRAREDDIKVMAEERMLAAG